MPRPTKPSPPRSHKREGARMVTLWLTEEQRARWDAAAAADGRDRSSWIRAVCDREAKRQG